MKPQITSQFGEAISLAAGASKELRHEAADHPSDVEREHRQQQRFKGAAA